MIITGIVCFVLGLGTGLFGTILYLSLSLRD